MRRVCWIAVLGLLTVTAIGCRSQASLELDALAGNWVPVSVEFKGQPDRAPTEMKVAIVGDTYTTTGGADVDRGTLKLDPSTPRKSMDIIGVEGPTKGTTLLAIYELKGDTLLICYDMAGQQRPTDFRTDRDLPHLLMVYEREKK